MEIVSVLTACELRDHYRVRMMTSQVLQTRPDQATILGENVVHDLTIFLPGIQFQAFLA